MSRAASWSGTPSIRGSTESMRMALLTFSLVGLQFTWGIEMTYCTPYLLQLGLSKSHTSAVWIAGPLSGLVMQPLVGVISDGSKSKWGRRRPFMIGGSVLVMACLLCLGWAEELGGIITSSEESKKTWTIVIAIGSIYATDFSINVVQSCCRSLVVDTLPIPKQQLGSAWASRMTAVGHLIGYAFGTIDLRSIWGNFLGNTQFKQLCVIAGLALVSCQCLTSYCVQERILISSKDSDKSGPLQSIGRIFRMTLHLPARIQAICWVQFWAWIGWFPFLFYSSTWVGEIYFRYNVPTGPETDDKLGEIGRVGSLSLVIFSTVTLICSVLLPFLIKSPERGSSRRFTPRPARFLTPIIDKIKPLIPQRPDLMSAWFVSHFVFAAAMMLAPFVRSIGSATFLVSLSGIPWALAGWAPFAFMGIEINRLSLNSNGHTRSHSLTSFASGPIPAGRLSTESQHPDSPSILRLNHSQGALGRDDSDDDGYDSTEDGSLLSGQGRGDKTGWTEGNTSTGETAGIYLGILNLFTTLPQFIGTFISMIVFAIFEPGKSENGKGNDQAKRTGGTGIAVCLFIGGVCSLTAAWVTRRLKMVR